LTEATRRRMTWTNFSEKVKERFCSEGAMQRVEREFRDLKKGSMTIAKFNSTFTEKHQFARNYCPDERSLIRHYTDGLPFEYRATVRQKTTLAAAMDEALKVEDDLRTSGRALEEVGEKRKRGDTSEPSKKKDRKQEKGEPREKANWCRRCKSSHEGECSNATMSCKKCGKLGHKAEDCKSEEPVCFNCWEMGHISTQCPNPKVPREVGMKKGKAPKAAGRE
jgi:Retrotransposon gag protein/Zinc knuckle